MSMYAAGRESGCRCPAKVENRTESAWRRRYLGQATSSTVGIGKEFSLGMSVSATYLGAGWMGPASARVPVS